METPTEKDRKPDKDAGCAVADCSAELTRKLALVVEARLTTTRQLMPAPRARAIAEAVMLAMKQSGVLPNISSQRTRHPMPDHQQTEAPTQEQRPGSL
jgi:hypothetical protein